jgi:hypothetical protein
MRGNEAHDRHTSRGFEPGGLFLDHHPENAGSPQQQSTYETPGEKIGPEQKQRNGPVLAILGQYSSGSFQFSLRASETYGTRRWRAGGASSRRVADRGQQCLAPLETALHQEPAARTMPQTGGKL